MGQVRRTIADRPAATADVTSSSSSVLSSAIAIALGGFVLTLEAAALTLDGFARQLTISNDVPPALLVIIYTVVGVVVARRQPRNAVGWVLIAAILLFLLSNDLSAYAVLHYRRGRALPFAPEAVLLEPVWIPSIALFPLVMLLFPDGRLTSRWRWVLWAYGGLVAVATAAQFGPGVMAYVHHDIHLDASGNLVAKGHASSGAAGSALAAVVVLSIAAIWVSFIAHQFISWRRSTGERRQQLKWVLCGAAIALVGGVLGSVLSTSAVGRVLFFAIVALPVSIGVAILKYRLYEIDRLISRTLSYAVVTGVVVGMYVGVVTLVTRVLGFSSPVAVAASPWQPSRSSTRSVSGSSVSSTAASTAPTSTPRRPSPPSLLGCATPSTSRRCGPSCCGGRQPGSRAIARLGVDQAEDVRQRLAKAAASGAHPRLSEYEQGRSAPRSETSRQS
jgi:hypothetical protein